MPCFNRVEATKISIPAFHKLFPEVPLVCVNSGSTDNTQQVLEEYKKSGIISHVISFETNVGVSAACNAGFDYAQTEYVMKLDNDIEIISTSWLDMYVDALEHFGNKAIFGMLVHDAGLARATMFKHTYTFSIRQITGVLSGPMLFIPKSLYLKVNKFRVFKDPYGWEDNIFSRHIRKIGGKIIEILPKEKVFIHHSEFDDEKYIKFKNDCIAENKKELRNKKNVKRS
jgi:glycosyltransferase involved in cell wall biosynthesis